MKQIAIYGKGGIGKSTISANLSASLALLGEKVLQIGCDPKHDSTRLLMRGTRIPTVLDYIRVTNPLNYKTEDILFRGFQNVGCIEAGGPTPGVGCAGRGIISAFELLDQLNIKKNYDTILYDVLGDVVCGGFAVPIRNEYADTVFIVTSGEYMSLYAANNILRGIANYDRDKNKVAGIIYNQRNIQDEDNRLQRFAEAVGLPICINIPRNNQFDVSEKANATLMEKFSDSPLSHIFKNLGQEIINGCTLYKANPVTDDELENIILNKKVYTVTSPICSGYENTAIEMIKQLNFPEKPMISSKVNILGISMFHKYFKGDIIEIKRLLSLCHIEAKCFLCSDCSLESIKNLSEAELNIVINPEYGYETAQFLKETYDTPYYVCDGPPIGFSATEKFIHDICEILKKDSTTFTEEAEKSRAMAYPYISRVNSLTGLPKGVNFAVEGTYSEIYSYTLFLTKYFGMIAESTSATNSERNIFKDRTEELFYTLGLNEALNKDIMNTTSELVFASGNTIAGLKLLNSSFAGIEISLPTLGYLDVIPKTHLGLQGALLIVEQVLNGLNFDSIK